MKHLTYFIFLIVLVPSIVYSQEPTATTTPGTTLQPVASPTDGVSDKIQELKDKVADKVASLKNDKLGGISGTLKSSSEEALILVSDNNEYSAQLDEDGKVYQLDSTLRKKEVQLDSLEKDTYLTVIGSIDKEKKTIEASIVVAKDKNYVFNGVIDTVNTKDGTVNIKTWEQKEIVFDIEINTISNIYDSTSKKLSKIGMSKMAQNQKIHIVSVAGKAENRYEAVRILILP